MDIIIIIIFTKTDKKQLEGKKKLGKQPLVFRRESTHGE